MSIKRPGNGSFFCAHQSASGTIIYMILLGMTGPIGHGKTTFAEALQKIEPTAVHLESSLIIAELANAWQATLEEPIDPYDINALNDWLRKLAPLIENMLQTPCSYDQLRLNPDRVDEHPIEYQKLILHVENLRRNFELAHIQIGIENKESYRPLLQWLGGYLVAHVDKGIWYNEIIRRAKQHEQEGSKLCIVGGLRFPNDAAILRTAGAIIIKIYRPGHLQSDMLDPTERERENIVVDSTVMSNGTIEDVDRFASVFLQDIKNDNLQVLYQTTRYSV